MLTPFDDELTPEGHEAIVACLRIAAARGRAIRLAREQAEQQKDTSAEMLGSDAANVPETNGTPLLPKDTTDV
jgi:hypothetical protein